MRHGAACKAAPLPQRPHLYQAVATGDHLACSRPAPSTACASSSMHCQARAGAGARVSPRDARQLAITPRCRCNRLATATAAARKQRSAAPGPAAASPAGCRPPRQRAGRQTRRPGWRQSGTPSRLVARCRPAATAGRASRLAAGVLDAGRRWPACTGAQGGPEVGSGA